MFETKPWLKYYGNIPSEIDYKKRTLYRAFRESAEAHPDKTALDFMGGEIKYSALLILIDQTAADFTEKGLKAGDRMTVCLPNCPEAIITFYALSKIGAVSSMIHPLSAPDEIEYYLNLSESRWAITLNAFYPRFADILDNTKVETVLITKLGTYMSPVMRTLFFLAKGRKIKSLPEDSRILLWADLMTAAGTVVKELDADPESLASLLYSGGTTGSPKGIMLSHMNFNVLGGQTACQGSKRLGPLAPGDSILAILPVFHGFGLAVCIHTFLINGGCSILVPQFSAEVAGKIIRKKRPTIMAGVPTLFEALSSNKNLLKADLSGMKGVFAGGDSVPISIKRDFDKVLKSRGADIELREGYGLTESVTVSVLMPEAEYREGSIGVPFPDMLAKIILSDSHGEAPIGTDGEICISGPSVMMGYLNNPEETAAVLQTHEDGRIWLHTGDIGCMDKDGFFYFKLRQKRMIKVSGVAVYPTQVEKVLESHPAVKMSCAIGIPDDYQLHKVKAFVILNEGYSAGPELEEALIAHSRKHINKWSCPRLIEFREELPLTRVGKIAYTELEKEEAESAG
jgi:long-chain acyl-CoA synthetase